MSDANGAGSAADGGSSGARSATRVKVCGITRERDRDAAVAAGADAVGVVCDVPVDTPREVDEATAADLLAGVPPLVTGVLVTMPDAVEQAVALADAVEPDALQVHGGLSPAELGALGRRFDGEVLVAVDAAADAEDDGTVDAYAAAADAVLVDSVGADGGGGTGETHDWDRTADLVDELEVPVLLAGGLAPGNVREAVATVDPYGVDVATGVERVEAGARVGGEKDHAAVREFVANATSLARREVAT